MANANVMYGITMQEQGVSRIVSVKLSQGQSQIAQEENSSSQERESVAVVNN